MAASSSMNRATSLRQKRKRINRVSAPPLQVLLCTPWSDHKSQISSGSSFSGIFAHGSLLSFRTMSSLGARTSFRSSSPRVTSTPATLPTCLIGRTMASEAPTSTPTPTIGGLSSRTSPFNSASFLWFFRDLLCGPSQRPSVVRSGIHFPAQESPQTLS